MEGSRDPTYMNDRKKPLGRTDFYWKCRDKDFEDFEVDLSELDGIYGGNAAELNDRLISNINQVAGRHFRKGKARNNKKVNKNRKWWNQEVKRAVQERRKANRRRRQMNKRHDKGEITDEEMAGYWDTYNRARNVASQKIGEAISSFEKSQLGKARENGKGENREWYSFIKGDQSKSFDYPSSIKVNGEQISDEVKIKEEIGREIYGGDLRGNQGKDEIYLRQRVPGDHR